MNSETIKDDPEKLRTIIKAYQKLIEQRSELADQLGTVIL